MKAVRNVPYILRNDERDVIGCGDHGCMINRNAVVFDDDSLVVVYSLEGRNRITSKTIFGRQFRKTMDKWDSKISFKHMQTRKLFAGYDKKTDFFAEIESTRILMAKLGEDFVSQNSTIPVKGVNRCVGVEFRRSDVHQYKNTVNYVIPTTACEANVLRHDSDWMRTRLYDLFVGLLAVVKRVQDAGLVHSDIKADNVVVCDGRFVLIDWGEMHGSLDADKPIASPRTNMPLSVSIQRRDRLMGFILSNFAFLRKYTQRLRGIRMDDEEYKRWLDIISGINVKQTRKILSEDRNPASVLAKHWKRLDLYCIGVTVLQVVVKHKIDVSAEQNQRVMKWVEKCITVGRESWGSADEALAEITSVTGGKEQIMIGKFGGQYVFRNGIRAYLRRAQK
jgi:hypothetical protein